MNPEKVPPFLPAHANPNYDTSPGNATTDKIFLLNILVAQNYFTSNNDRRAAATPYAQVIGAYVYNFTDFQHLSG